MPDDRFLMADPWLRAPEDPAGVEHVIRSRPPWRRGDDLTECGKLVSEGAALRYRSMDSTIRHLIEQLHLMRDELGAVEPSSHIRRWKDRAAAGLNHA